MPKIVRFSKDNWNRFFTHGKVQTTRMHILTDGPHPVYSGPRFKPVKLGEVVIHGHVTKKFSDLTEEDAKKDGFDNLGQYKGELYRLNLKGVYKCLREDTLVVLHECHVTQGKQVDELPLGLAPAQAGKIGQKNGVVGTNE